LSAALDAGADLGYGIIFGNPRAIPSIGASTNTF
jgi:hypothetical protein